MNRNHLFPYLLLMLLMFTLVVANPAASMIHTAEKSHSNTNRLPDSRPQTIFAKKEERLDITKLRETISQMKKQQALTAENRMVEADSTSGTGEMYDTAVSVLSGNHYDAYLIHSNDTDFYTLQAAGKGTVMITLREPSGKRYNLAVFDEQYDLIDQSGDADSNVEQVTISLDDRKHYHIAVFSIYSDYSVEDRYLLEIGTVQYPVISMEPADLEVLTDQISVVQFQPSKSGVYTFQTGPAGGTGPEYDTWLLLVADPNAKHMIAYNDDAGGGTTFSEVTADLAAGQTYYLLLFSLTEDGPFSTRLTVSYSHPEVTTVACNSPVDVSTAQGEAAYYRFRPVKTAYYRFYTDHQDAGRGADTTLHLYDDLTLSHQLAANDDADTDTGLSAINYHLLAGKEYYIRAAGANGQAVSVWFSIGQGYGDGTDDGTVRYSLAAGDAVAYEVTPGQSGTYRLDLGSANNILLQVYEDAALSKLVATNAASNGTLTPEINCLLRKGSSYYVKLSGAEGQSAAGSLTVAPVFALYEYQYGTDGTLSSVQQDGVTIAQFTYDDNGNLLNRTRQNQ